MTSSAFFIGALLLVCTLPLSSAGYIDLKINLVCKEVDNWCSEVYVYEEDTFSSNDFMAMKKVCAPAGQTEYLIDFGRIEMNGDMTPNYEVMTLVSHTCSKSKEWFCAKPSSPLSVPAYANQVIQYTVTIDAKSDTKGMCSHPPPPSK